AFSLDRDRSGRRAASTRSSRAEPSSPSTTTSNLCTDTELSMTTSDTAVPEPTPEQAVLFARVRRMMLIAGLTTALAVCAVLIAVGYRLFKSEGRAAEPVSNVTATLPKGAKIVA